MTHPFEQRVICNWPTRDWSDVTVLAAVSGGADSLALLRSLLAIRPESSGQLMAVHFNHRLRGQESDDDQFFVREQCSRLAIECWTESAAEQNGPPAEDAARQARYDFFCQIAKKTGARYLATAHTADDQAETILHRILRGTGVDGLAGIPKSRELLPGVALTRPLLWSTRNEILQYLDELQQPFRHDASNDETRFTRNRLRHQLIPQLEQEYNPRVREALLRLGELAAETHGTISTLVEPIRQAAVSRLNEHDVSIRCDAFRGSGSHLVRQTLIEVWRECGWPMQSMTAEHWRKLGDLASTDSQRVGRIDFPGGIVAERDGSILRLVQHCG